MKVILNLNGKTIILISCRDYIIDSHQYGVAFIETTRVLLRVLHEFLSKLALLVVPHDLFVANMIIKWRESGGKFGIRIQICQDSVPNTLSDIHYENDIYLIQIYILYYNEVTTMF